jgi:small subunit ribosomal protein S6
MAGRRYETLVLFHPDQGEPGAKDLTARIRSLIEDQGGTISQVLEWGMRDLAYPIAKQRRAIYVLFEYRVSVEGLREIERNIKLTDAVLRFISVQQAENAPPATLRQNRSAETDTAEADDGGGDFDLADGEGV